MIRDAETFRSVDASPGARAETRNRANVRLCAPENAVDGYGSALSEDVRALRRVYEQDELDRIEAAIRPRLEGSARRTPDAISLDAFDDD